MHDNAEKVKWPSAKEIQRQFMEELSDAGTLYVRSGSRWGFTVRALEMQGKVKITRDGVGHGKRTSLEVTLV